MSSNAPSEFSGYIFLTPKFVSLDAKGLPMTKEVIAWLKELRDEALALPANPKPDKEGKTVTAPVKGKVLQFKKYQ